ncbi:CMP-sialic acid transporter 1 [Orchesella cincta]|uniref:CMP-sialic acid transporter 1 n=1 Tax=Orchesella cincta TaxID=48709 RepID=A0A1D2N564_ORCCI|nr:CMP-sialic acid transporter 1 [Orchesella cincta]
MGSSSMSLSQSQTKWSDLFPTRWSPVIFVLYMALFINQGILVTASQNKNHKGYTYNTVLAVLLTEFIKLIVSVGLFIERNSLSIFIAEIRQNSRVFFLYFIPAGLYCLYNNLAYVNLVTFDPTTYFLLLQFRVVVTGVVFQVLFEKRLSRHQWVSLMFLTVGCMIKEIKFDGLFGVEDSDEALAQGGSVNLNDIKKAQDAVSKPEKWVLFENPVGVVLILLQVLCSSGAGVYNEYLLKRPVASHQKQTPILIQNVCLYIDSIICNLSILAFQGKLKSVLEYDTLGIIIYTPIILAVVLNNAAIGIVTSFFLAQLNSILKTFASALELMFTAVLCWMIFGIPIHINTVLAIFIVTWAIFLYSKEPVVNSANTNALAPSVNTKRRSRDAEDLQKMLDDELDV